MTDGLRAMATWGQAVSITPFCLMGAMAPDFSARRRRAVQC